MDRSQAIATNLSTMCLLAHKALAIQVSYPGPLKLKKLWIISEGSMFSFNVKTP